MTDRRPLLIMLAILVIVVAGGFAYKLTQNKASSAHTVAEHDVTTTTAPQPTIVASQIDWQAQLNKVIAGENTLFQNPDPSKVNTIMLPTCSCFADTTQRLTNLQSKGWHVKGNATNIKVSSFISGTATSITLYVQPVSAGNPTVDAHNNVVDQPTVGPSLGMVYVLDKGSDGVWRIADRHLLAEQVPS